MLSLGMVREATGTEAVRAFLEERILAGSDWNLESAGRRSVRLDPPRSYWAVYRVRLRRDNEARELRLVARAAFDESAWVELRRSLEASSGGRPCDPLRGTGFPVLFDETRHAFWFYPFDPELPSLIPAADPARVLRLFRENKRELMSREGRVSRVEVERARYVPEQSAILRYRPLTDPPDAGRTVYGRVQRGGDGAESDRLMREVWRVAAASDGALRVPRPLGYFPELDLVLQEAVDGDALGSDRTAPEFLAGADAAARALAAIHDAAIDTPVRMTIDGDLEQLDGVLDQFALVHPEAYRLLRQLLSNIRGRLSRTPEEESIGTHGDFKYDQLLHHEGRFSVIDFDYFGRAETSYDLARFCAHAVPSMPQSFEDSAAGEEARATFLTRYRELRPDATLDRFPVYEAIDLATRAMVMMWTQMDGWGAAAEGLLVLAMERLREPPP